MKFFKNGEYRKIMPENLIKIAGKIDFIDTPDRKRLSLGERFKLELHFYISNMSDRTQETIKGENFTNIIMEEVRNDDSRFVAYFDEIRCIIPEKIANLWNYEIEIKFTNN